MNDMKGRGITKFIWMTSLSNTQSIKCIWTHAAETCFDALVERYIVSNIPPFETHTWLHIEKIDGVVRRAIVRFLLQESSLKKKNTRGWDKWNKECKVILENWILDLLFLFYFRNKNKKKKKNTYMAENGLKIISYKNSIENEK